MKYGYELKENLYNDIDFNDLYERAFSEGYEFAQREFTVANKFIRQGNAIKKDITNMMHKGGMSFRDINAAKRNGTLFNSNQQIQAAKEGFVKSGVTKPSGKYQSFNNIISKVVNKRANNAEIGKMTDWVQSNKINQNFMNRIL